MPCTGVLAVLTCEHGSFTRRLRHLHLRLTVCWHSELGTQGPVWHMLLHRWPQAICLSQSFPQHSKSLDVQSAPTCQRHRLEYGSSLQWKLLRKPLFLSNGCASHET